jgi:hypothetical protein
VRRSAASVAAGRQRLAQRRDPLGPYTMTASMRAVRRREPSV